MKVLLKEDVEKLGMAGEVRDVADGYGRNFLIPQGLAVKATTGTLKQAEMWRERAANRRAQLRAEHDTLSAKIQGVQLFFNARAGESGKLYGSITMAEIADRLNEKLGTDLDRRKIEGEPLRLLGEHTVRVHLSGEHRPNFTVVVGREGETLESWQAAKAAKEAEAAAAAAAAEQEEAAGEMEAVA
jgi:large subunit ribosomal protein L9